jgi:hypothetical protein
MIGGHRSARPGLLAGKQSLQPAIVHTKPRTKSRKKTAIYNAHIQPSGRRFPALIDTRFRIESQTDTYIPTPDTGMILN